jgi:hypothetical protein
VSVTTSGFGTFETCRLTMGMSVNRGRPEVAVSRQNDANDPFQTKAASRYGSREPPNAKPPVRRQRFGRFAPGVRGHVVDNVGRCLLAANFARPTRPAIPVR